MNNPFKSYEEATKFLLEMVDYEKVSKFKYSAETFNLARVEELMDSVGGPHRKLRALHIAGTKGKGSVAMMAESVLRASGLKTGLYTQPHLTHLEERVQINGASISKEMMVELVEALYPYVHRVRIKTPHESPTFFDLTTAIAFLCFDREKVDVAVIEVGLGGRLDSTNVIHPQVCAITKLDYDHMDRLGHTLDKIAAEKAGIIKPGVPVVSWPQAPEALRVVEERCREKNAPLLLVGRDAILEDVESILTENSAGVQFTLRTPRSRYEDLFVPLLGRHQAWNAATAVLMLELLAEKSGLALSEESVRRGLSTVRCPGRLELLWGRPLVLLDTAHNVASFAALGEVLKEHFSGRRIVLLLGLSRDKDMAGIVRSIVPFAAHVIVTMSDNPRAARPHELRELIQKETGVEPETYDSAIEALARARSIAGPDDVLLITGSFFLTGMLRPHVVRA